MRQLPSDGRCSCSAVNRQHIAIDLATELAELAKKDAAELRKLTAALVDELATNKSRGSSRNAEQ